MRTLNTSILALILSSCLFAFASCELPTVDTQSSGIKVGKVKTIAKSEGQVGYSIAHAMVGINKVEIRNIAGQFLTMSEEASELDLVTLNSNFSVLFRARIPEGDYDNIRLQTSGDGVVELDNGAQYPLKVPSGEQSGIKVFFDKPVHVVFGQLLKVYLVIDLSQSFHQTGNGRFQMKPVIHAQVVSMQDMNPSGGTEVPGDTISNDTNAGGTDTSGDTNGTGGTGGTSGTGDAGGSPPSGFTDPVDNGWYPVLGI
jgi:hypothetical protein